MKNFLIFTTFLVTTANAHVESLDLRLSLGDEAQEKRTTAVNWPPAAKKVAAPKPAAVVPPPPVAPRQFRVMVDVGHGGHDFGAPGHFGILEKEICLRIASHVKARLERSAKLADFPMEVRLSRETDRFIPLRERAREANQWGADLFISVHANSSPVARARGFEVYFLSNEATDEDATRVAQQENTDGPVQVLSTGVRSILSDLQTNAHILESSRFAESVYSALSERLRPNGKGVRQAPFSVLSGTQMPALLIEVGYLTNSQEAADLARNAYQLRVGSSLADGVLDFALRMRRHGRLGALRFFGKYRS